MFLKLFAIFTMVILTVQSLTLQIDEGLINGKLMTTKNGRTFTGFIGIPYAEPPIGPLRFKPPIAKTPWNGTRESLDLINVCPQFDVIVKSTILQGDEDCLYLNVYTPKLDDNYVQLLPVMIFIHGGAFNYGHANLYTPEILLDKDVVLVTINYRLGALGFLTTGDDIVAGNNGLKDQNFAIRWTKKNIRAFGGDPNLITLFGESAGAASVHLHMISPLSKGLIQRGISESGSALSFWSFSKIDVAKKISTKLAKKLQCPTNNNAKMIDCLRKHKAQDIVMKTSQLMKFVNTPVAIFTVVAEYEHPGAFLTKHPLHYIKSGNVANIPWITGINTNEGGYQSSILLSNSTHIEKFKQNLFSFMPASLHYEEHFSNFNEITKKLKDYYFDKGLDNDIKQNLTDLYTDAWFLAGTDASIRLHLTYITNQPIYYYFFTYKGAHSFTQLYSPIDFGVSHLDELLYLFPVSDQFYHTKQSKSDKEMSNVLTDLWYNFAKTGKPFTIKSNDTFKWNNVRTKDDMEYLRINGPNDLTQKSGIYLDRIKFWKPIINDFINTL